MELLEPLEGGTESPDRHAPVRGDRGVRAPSAFPARAPPDRHPGLHRLALGPRGLGTVAYGFAPVFAMDLARLRRGMHGADESLAVDDLVEMAEFHLYLARALA